MFLNKYTSSLMAIIVAGLSNAASAMYVDGNPLGYIDPNGLTKVILFPKDDPNRPGAENELDDPAVCLVYSHGSPATVNHWDAKQLNVEITNRGCTPKQPVRLDACRTGEGKNSIAEQLAKVRRGTVVAPTNRTWTTPWNRNISGTFPPVSDDPTSIWNGVPNWYRPGEWRTFGPKGPIPPTDNSQSQCEPCQSFPY